MIVDIERIKKLGEFKSFDDEEIAHRIKSIESMIRNYTNNSFINRNTREAVNVVDNTIETTSEYFKLFDTIQIVNSKINDGVYTITEMVNGGFKVDGSLMDGQCEIYLVQYPFDVVEGVLKIMKYDIATANKVGIASETISRHSVTYLTQDANNTSMGYPSAMVSFLKPYRKAKFE